MDEGWRVTTPLLRDLDRMMRSDGARLVVFHADRDPRSEAKLRDILRTLDVPTGTTKASRPSPTCLLPPCFGTSDGSLRPGPEEQRGSDSQEDDVGRPGREHGGQEI